ncbi:MAG: NAD(P)-dependent oxidoreductase, partial [Chloroflexota bacterium]
MPNVVFFTNLVPEITTLLTASLPKDFSVQIHASDLPDEEKITLVADADFIILFPDKISDEVLQAAPKLKLIQLVSVGFDRMNLDLCRQRNIPVANNGGANSTDVAEHTLYLILGLYRRSLELDYDVRHDQWRRLDSGLTTYTIDGKTVGIVGFGQIGRKVTRLVQAFGAEVIYYDPYPPDIEVDQEMRVQRASLPDLLKQADVVSLHVPLNDDTRHLISKDELSLMKESAILINTCRGPIVDEFALTMALDKNEIAGAGLDVLEQEPPD